LLCELDERWPLAVNMGCGWSTRWMNCFDKKCYHGIFQANYRYLIFHP
jgi:hypothetical protein